MKRSLYLFINDIVENIKDIESFSRGLSKEKLRKSKLKQNAIVRSLEIIGEAVKNIPDSFREEYSEVPWKKIAGLRDIITHAYFKIDLDITWNIIKKDLPELKEKILRIKNNFKE